MHKTIIIIYSCVIEITEFQYLCAYNVMLMRDEKEGR